MPETVTILIPTYARPDYLVQAIESAIQQTYAHLEILILDDASPDNTSEAVKPYLNDSRVRYIRHTENIGIAKNWLAGFSQMQGDYFCFLHDDDTYEPTCIEKLLAPLQQDNDLIVSFSDHWAMRTDGERDIARTEITSRRFGRDKLAPGKVADFAEATLIGKTVPITASLYHKRFVQEDFFTEKAQGSIDAYFLYRCAATGKGAFYIPERLVNYREHIGGVSHSKPIFMTEGHLFRLREALQNPDMAHLHTKLNTMYYDALTFYGVYLLRGGRREEAQAALRELPKESQTLKSKIALALSHCGELGTYLMRQAKTIG